MQTTYDDPNVILIKAEAAEYWEIGNLAKNIAFMYKRMRGRDVESPDVNETEALDR